MQGKPSQFAKCISLLLVLAGVVSSTPDNPCPQLFEYELVGNEWVGKVRLDGVKVGQNVNLNVILSLPALLSTSNIGRLDLFDGRQQAVQGIFQNKPLLYKVSFPLQDPLPRVTEIKVNNKVVCSGPAETSPQVTNIKLYHTFYTRVKTAESGTANDIESAFGDLTSYTHEEKKEENKDAATPETVTPEPVVTPAIARPPNKPTPPPKQVDAICGQPVSDVAQFVVGGESAKKGEWPWLAAIFVNEGAVRSFQCGGTLLTAKLTITAAHCFFRNDQRAPISASEIFTAVGRYNVNNWSEPGSLFLSTERIEFPPDYYRTDSFEDDIAVIRHTKAVSFTQFPHIRPICMWSGSSNTLEIEGRKGTVVGWGKDEFGNEVSPEPKKIDIGIVSRKNCIRGSSKLEAVTARTNFCAGDKDGRGPCTGDSGSGLVIYNNGRWELRGIVAGTVQGGVTKTNQLCQLDEFVVYVDVIQFADWLRNFFVF